MSTHFILVRHGQTDWNQVERFRGRSDIPLNDVGREQARRVANHLASEPISTVYAGPLRRTMATAAPLAEARRLPVQATDALIDIDFGALHGMTPEEAYARFPEVVAGWMARPASVHFPGGESLADVRARVSLGLRDLAQRHAGETVVLVTHKIAGKVILCEVLGLPDDAIWRVELDNASISRFEYGDGGWVVQTINDTCHLGTPL